MGACPCSCQSPPNECDYDVYVRKYVADIQHHDGLYALQESCTGSPADKPGLHEVRDRRNEKQAMDGQGCLCTHEPGRSGPGNLEGQWDGTATVSGFNAT